MPPMNHYWSSSQAYRSEIISNTMLRERERFELFLKLLHFLNNDSKDSSQNRLIKLQPTLDLLRVRLSSIYIPDSVVNIDQTMMPKRGRFWFRKRYS